MTAGGAPHRDDARPASRPRVALVVTGGLVLALVAVLLLLHLVGFRSFVVRTASMGTTAPVGTLVVTTPVEAAAVRVDDVLTFLPPGGGGDATVTHRVVGAGPEGITTRGDASEATDPWLLHDVDLVGRAVAVLPVVGWVVRAVPLLVLGGAAVWALTLLVPSHPHRSALRVVGGALVVAVTSAVLRPFTAATMLATHAGDDGGGVASVVSTGILPVKLSTDHGAWTVLRSGEVGELDLPATSEAGVGALISLAPHLSAGGWAVCALVCLLPLLWCTTVGLAPTDAPTGRRAATS